LPTRIPEFPKATGRLGSASSEAAWEQSLDAFLGDLGLFDGSLPIRKSISAPIAHLDGTTWFEK
jgi:hypothetical protein